MNAITPRIARGVVAVRAQAGGDVAELHAELKAAIQEFEAGHSRRLDEIEARLNRTTLGGGGIGGGDDADIQAAADFMSAAQRRPISPSDVDPDQLNGYREAFATYLRRGPATPPDVLASMSVGSDPDGGYLVSPSQSREMFSRMFETSPMRQVASTINITGDAIEFPLDTNDATLGGWVGETESRSTTATPQLGMQRIPVHEQYAQPEVTQKLLDDSDFPVETWLNDKIADKLGRAENTSFVSGNGVSKPRGFLDYKSAAVTTDDASRSWGVLQYVPTGAAGGFPDTSGVAGAKDPDALITTVHKLKADYRRNAVWVMNRATAGAVRKLKDGEGRYLWADSIAAGQPDRLLGYPVVEFEDMPDIASDSYSIAFGDFRRGYLIVDRIGVRVLRDPYTTKGYVKFYARKRVGGDVRDFDSIKLVKFGAS